MHTRPSWQIDAKWLAAIAFVLCAAAAGLTYSVYRLTAYGPATGAAAPVIETMTQGALNDELYAKVQQAAQASPNAEITVDGLTLPLRGREIAGLSKDALLKLASARVADILYYQGVAAGERYFQDLTPGDATPPPEAGQTAPAAEDEGLQLDMLAFLTEGSHSAAQPFYIVSGLLALALLGLVVFLSRGFGRLGSPGVALFIAAGPFALATTVLRGVTSDAPAGGGAGTDLKAALNPAFSDLASVFGALAILALAMAAVAVAGQATAILVGRWRRYRASRATAASSPA